MNEEISARKPEYRVGQPHLHQIKHGTGTGAGAKCIEVAKCNPLAYFSVAKWFVVVVGGSNSNQFNSAEFSLAGKSCTHTTTNSREPDPLRRGRQRDHNSLTGTEGEINIRL